MWIVPLIRQIEFTPAAAQQLKKLGPENSRRIIKILQEKVRRDPYKHGKVLKGALREFRRYRIGDFRVLAHIEEERVLILIVRVCNRREVYAKRQVTSLIKTTVV